MTLGGIAPDQVITRMRGLRMGQMDTATRPWLRVMAPAGIFLAALGTFFPALYGGFIWDDTVYLLSQPEARAINWASLRWAFSLDAAVAGHYHPLTWLSWMVDFALAGGPDPFVFHLTNLILHGAHCVLVWLLFRALFQAAGYQVADGAIFLAVLLYAVHPLRVESVAWITERRDLLCGVFYAATLWAYLQTGKAGSSRRWMIITLVLFVACGLSKAWVVSLLPVMWIIDALLLRRIAPLHDVSAHLAWLVVRAPMLLATIVFLVAGLLAAHRSGAMVGLEDLGPVVRLKPIWPVSIAPYYGWAAFEVGGSEVVAGSIGLAVVWLLALSLARRAGWVVALLLAYTAIIMPVLGLAQSGPQLVADRYTYIAILPFHCVLAALIGRFWPRPQRWISVLSFGAMLAIAVVLAHGAWRLNDVFRDDMAFWSRAVEISPGDVTARHNRAKLAWALGRHELAIADLRAADQTNPKSGASLATLVELYLVRGEIEQARALLIEARERGLPESLQLLWRSRIASAEGDTDAAHDALRGAAELEPGDPALWLALARSFGSRGDRTGALVTLDRALEKSPQDPDLRLERAVHLAASGRSAEALDEIHRALVLAPRDWISRSQALAWQAQIQAGLRATTPEQ
jgi:protein O-mannosyl-transferase